MPSLQDINKEESLLEKDQSQFPMLQTLLADKQPHEQLWTTALNFQVMSDEWMNGTRPAAHILKKLTAVLILRFDSRQQALKPFSLCKLTRRSFCQSGRRENRRRAGPHVEDSAQADQVALGPARTSPRGQNLQREGGPVQAACSHPDHHL